MDCLDSQTRLYFPLLLAWIADHAHHAALEEIVSKPCPKREVLCEERSGDQRRIYESRDSMRYREKA